MKKNIQSIISHTKILIALMKESLIVENFTNLALIKRIASINFGDIRIPLKGIHLIKDTAAVVVMNVSEIRDIIREMIGELRKGIEIEIARIMIEETFINGQKTEKGDEVTDFDMDFLNLCIFVHRL